MRRAAAEIVSQAVDRVDYVEIRDPETLEARDRVGAGALLAVAAHVGTTRLIDNCVLVPGAPAVPEGLSR